MKSHLVEMALPRNRPRPLTSSVIALKISKFSYLKPLQISETEKIGKFYVCVFQSFALPKKKFGVRCTLRIRFYDSPVLSKSFEVDVSTEKVGGSLLFERQRRELPRGVWAHAPPRKF